MFAAAEEGLAHSVREELMLYPGYEPFMGSPPSILHYGTDYVVRAMPGEPANFTFNKMYARTPWP